MLQVKNLSITHKKDLRVILEDFSCVLNAGDKAVIIGEEGNGKSTLLKWIYDPESIEGYAEGKGERIVTRERLGYLPQELPMEDKEKTVCEYFMEEPWFLECSPKELGKLAGDFRLPCGGKHQYFCPKLQAGYGDCGPTGHSVHAAVHSHASCHDGGGQCAFCRTGVSDQVC